VGLTIYAYSRWDFMNEILKVENLNLTYQKGGPQVLFDISFSVSKSDFYAIIGPSGAGKSSLIRCINKLADANSGNVLFKGENITKLSGKKLRSVRRKIGMIFQEFNLIDRMSVIDNILTGRLGYMNTFTSLFRMFDKKDISRAIALIEKVGLGDFANKRVDQLSGGQRQRVGIARALMQEPEIMLVDEPTSSLDPKIAIEMMELIKGIAEELKIPVLCNIHNIDLAKQFANRILGLQDGKKKFDDTTDKLTHEVLQDLYKYEVL
jgi:phosphonate transport system ATP-binding protein